LFYEDLQKKDAGFAIFANIYPSAGWFLFPQLLPISFPTLKTIIFGRSSPCQGIRKIFNIYNTNNEKVDEKRNIFLAGRKVPLLQPACFY
jgi:hypothetical protein